jgi:putative Flp pilus-assembly TadE/G-like protein
MLSSDKATSALKAMRLKNRRGVALVIVSLVAITLLTVLAIVVDMSRMYQQKNELQTAADAAALAGIVQHFEDTLYTVDSAVSMGQKNRVLQASISVASADVKCGVWNAITKTYGGDSDHCGAHDNAVSVTTRDSARYVFAGLLGTSKQVTAFARAYAAYVGNQKCIKPWAVPYTKLTKTLQPTNPDSLRDLDSLDASLLKSLSKAERTFMLKIGTPPNSGNFGSLHIPDLDPDAPNGGANLYSYNITQCNSTLIGPGDTIETETGNMKGPTDKGVEDFCENNGTYQKSTGNCYAEDGTLGIPVKAALWSFGTTKSNGKFAVIVRQIVSFVLENLSNDTEITGYFLPLKTSGAITTTVTTTQRPILIK